MNITSLNFTGDDGNPFTLYAVATGGPAVLLIEGDPTHLETAGLLRAVYFAGIDRNWRLTEDVLSWYGVPTIYDIGEVVAYEGEDSDRTRAACVLAQQVRKGTARDAA